MALPGGRDRRQGRDAAARREVALGAGRIADFFGEPADQRVFKTGRPRSGVIHTGVAIDRGSDVIAQRARVQAAAWDVAEEAAVAQVLAAAVHLLGQSGQRLIDADGRFINVERAGLSRARIFHEDRFVLHGR